MRIANLIFTNGGAQNQLLTTSKLEGSTLKLSKSDCCGSFAQLFLGLLGSQVLGDSSVIQLDRLLSDSAVMQQAPEKVSELKQLEEELGSLENVFAFLCELGLIGKNSDGLDNKLDLLNLEETSLQEGQLLETKENNLSYKIEDLKLMRLLGLYDKEVNLRTREEGNAIQQSNIDKQISDLNVNDELDLFNTDFSFDCLHLSGNKHKFYKSRDLKVGSGFKDAKGSVERLQKAFSTLESMETAEELRQKGLSKGVDFMDKETLSGEKVSKGWIRQGLSEKFDLDLQHRLNPALGNHKIETFSDALRVSKPAVGILKGLSEKIVDQIVSKLRTAIVMNKIPGGLRLRLHPPELGSLQIDLKYADSKDLQIHIFSEKELTHHILKEHINDLRHHISENLKVSDPRIELSLFSKYDDSSKWNHHNSGGNKQWYFSQGRDKNSKTDSNSDEFSDLLASTIDISV